MIRFLVVLFIPILFVAVSTAADIKDGATALPPEYWKNRTKFSEECRQNHTVTQDEIDKFVKHLPKPDFTAWCFAACVGKLSGFIAGNNTMSVSGFLDRLKLQNETESNFYAQRLAVINKCAEKLNIPDPDDCAIAQKILNCTGMLSTGFKMVTSKLS